MTQHWNRVTGTLLLVTALTLGQITLAQEAVEPESLGNVATAFENTRDVTSLHMVSQSLTETSTGANGFAFSTQQTQEFDLARTDDGWNTAGSLVTSIILPIGAIELGAEVISVDGVTYVRFNQVPEGIPLDLPQDWVDLEQFTAGQGTNSGQPLNGNLPLGTSSDQLLAPLMIPMNGQAVTQITVLPSDEINGQTMRVYQITVDPAVVLESDASSLLSINAPGGFDGFPGGAVNGFPPQGAPELPDPDELTALTPEDIQMTFAVYIGEADGRVHRIYSIVAVAARETGDSTTPAITVTSIIDYSRFNEPVEIIIPEITS
jgi:hypothetical protein